MSGSEPSLFRPGSERVDHRLEGEVAHEVFRSADGAFSVVRLTTSEGETVTVAGPLPATSPGEELTIEGEWTNDPRHGLQFRAKQAWVRPPSTRRALERYLGSGAVSGVGRELAQRILERFGDEALKVLDEEPHRLLEVRGIGAKKLAAIQASWAAQQASRDVMLFLRGHGLGPALAQRVFERFGAATRQAVEEDPYRLAREVEGVGFRTADRVARALGIGADDPRRLRAGLLHVADETLAQGHTALPSERLLEEAARQLGAAPEQLAPALLEARERGALERAPLPGPEGELDLIYLPGVLRAERGAAHLVAGMLDPRLPRRLPTFDVDRALTWLAAERGLEPSAAQAEALRVALAAPLTVITGGPGVGKTTVVRALVELLRAKRAKFALCAPTGRAAKRLEEATGAEAATVHRLLEWDPRGGGFGRGAQDPLEVDVLVLDEASMVDVRLLHAVLRALPVGAALILIGDVDQLPSVGPGAVLADLIESGAAQVVRLTEVFRQAAASRIVTAAHAINEGIVPELTGDAEGSDFFFVSARDPEAARSVIVRLVRERIPARFGLDPLKDVQVLAPMHRGACGTEALNRALKEALLGAAPTEEGRGRLDLGDKVMQLKNDYEHEVFNGDVGRVTHADPDGTVVVDFDGREVVYARGDRSRLALAYCATIHKAQGSEYPAVVIPVLTEHFVMLERNLLYTGLTRARKLAVLVGQRRALELAVQNDRPRQRVSHLGTRVRLALAAGPDGCVD